jgi:hypothetical protein
MVSSARRSRACCIPLPVMRFAVFPATERPRRPVRDRWCGGPGHFPRRRSYPSKNSTRSQPFHITVAVAPLPLPSARLGLSSRFRCQFRVSRLCRREARLRGFPPPSGP